MARFVGEASVSWDDGASGGKWLVVLDAHMKRRQGVKEIRKTDAGRRRWGR